MAEIQEGLFYYRLKVPTFWPQAGTAAALACRACLVTAVAPAQLLQELRVQCEVSFQVSPSLWSMIKKQCLGSAHKTASSSRP